MSKLKRFLLQRYFKVTGIRQAYGDYYLTFGENAFCKFNDNTQEFKVYKPTVKTKHVKFKYRGIYDE
jgi:hypothetical protein